MLVNSFLLDVGNGDSSRQETVCEWFPTRRGKWGFIATGNCLRMVSYPACDDGKSSWQETVCEWFPTRRGTMGIHRGRKLFANGFPFDMGRLHIIATGNFSSGDFSTPLCCARNDRGGGNYCVSWRQGTSRKSFLSGMEQWQIIVAGNCLRMVSYPAWGDCVL